MDPPTETEKTIREKIEPSGRDLMAVLVAFAANIPVPSMESASHAHIILWLVCVALSSGPLVLLFFLFACSWIPFLSAYYLRAILRLISLVTVAVGFLRHMLLHWEQFHSLIGIVLMVSVVLAYPILHLLLSVFISKSERVKKIADWISKSGEITQLTPEQIEMLKQIRSDMEKLGSQMERLSEQICLKMASQMEIVSEQICLKMGFQMERVSEQICLKMDTGASHIGAKIACQLEGFEKMAVLFGAHMERAINEIQSVGCKIDSIRSQIETAQAPLVAQVGCLVAQLERLASQMQRSAQVQPWFSTPQVAPTEASHAAPLQVPK